MFNFIIIFLSVLALIYILKKENIIGNKHDKEEK